MKITSQAQQRFLGAIASGKANGTAGPSPMKAATMLKENRGMKASALPERAPMRMPKRMSNRGYLRSGGR